MTNNRNNPHNPKSLRQQNFRELWGEEFSSTFFSPQYKSMQSRIRYYLLVKGAATLSLCVILALGSPSNNSCCAAEQQTSSVTEKVPLWKKPFVWTNDVPEANEKPIEKSPSKKLERPSLSSISTKQKEVKSQPKTVFESENWPIAPFAIAEPSTTVNSNANAVVQASSEQRYSPSQSAPPRSQGLNPFSWTNVPSSNRQVSYSQPSSAPSSPAGLAKPFVISNDAPSQRPQSLDAPPLPPIGKYIHKALSFGDDYDPQYDGPLVTGSPPEDASDAEMIAWEKEKFPWVRPFYAAENPQDEITPRQEYYAQQNQKSSWLANPFTLTNDPIPNRVVDKQALEALPASYFQNEEIPVPGQDSEGSETLATPEGEGQLPVGLGDADQKGALAEAAKLGKEPVDNSLQFLRASTVLLKPGQFQFDYGLAYTLFESSAVLLADLGGGDYEVGLTSFRQRELFSPFQLRMGLLRRAQMFLSLPVGWANTEFTDTFFREEFENDGGIGDLSFGTTFLLRQGNHECPDITFTLAATAPTGKDPFGLSILAPTPPALGNGTWSMAANLLWIQNYDPIVLFYGFGTRQHFSREVNGLSFQAGQEYNYNMGLGFGVNEKVTLSTRFRGSYVTESRINGQRIIGTIQEPMSLEVAATISRCKCLVEPFVNFGLTEGAHDVSLGVVWTRY